MWTLDLLHVTLGLVWEAVPAAVEAGVPAMQAARVAAQAAVPALASAPMLLLGAGVLGFSIGTQIKQAFGIDTPIPQPTTPFQGGQTNGRYQVVVDGQVTGVNIYPITFGNIAGPIVGIKSTYDATSFPEPRFRYGLFFDGGAQGAPVGDLKEDDIQVAPYIQSLTRIDAPDGPKNPVPEYPLAPFDPGILNPTVPFPYLPGNPEYPVEIVPFKRPGGTPSAPVTNPGQEEEPKVTVNIPDLGISIDFDKDGVTPRAYNPQAYPAPQKQNDPRVSPPTRPPTTCECPCDLDPVLDKLDEIKEELDDVKECACEPEYTNVIVGLGGGQSLVATLPVDTVSVTLTLSQIPETARTQSGVAALDVIYAGWYAFSDGTGRGGERLPVHYANNTYFPPERATVFSYTLYEGFSATLSATKRVKQED